MAITLPMPVGALAFFNNPTNSKWQEQFCEYVFLSVLLGQAAASNQIISILRNDFDAFGSDIIVASGNTHAAIQLKSASTETTPRWRVHMNLLENEQGHVVLIKLSGNQQHQLQVRFFTLTTDGRVRSRNRFGLTRVGDYLEVEAQDLLSLLFPQQ